MKDQICIS